MNDFLAGVLIGFSIGIAVANVYWFIWSINNHAKLERKYGMKLTVN